MMIAAGVYGKIHKEIKDEKKTECGQTITDGWFRTAPFSADELCKHCFGPDDHVYVNGRELTR